jgi:SAM-dependent methyltransferase
MGMFFRRSPVGTEPLPLSMSGIRAGERLLQIGLDDAAFAEAMASKVGLNGRAVFAVTERDASRAQAIAASSGVLADVHVVSFSNEGQWPIDDASCDVVIVHGRRGLLASLDDRSRQTLLSHCLGALRPGGRLVAMDAGASEGIAALLGRGPKPDAAYEGAGGTAKALESAGFRPVRLLAERDGYRFTEGLRPLH